MTAEPFNFQDPKSSHDDGSKPSSDDGKKVDEDPRKDSECKDQEKDPNVNNTNNVNTVSSTVDNTDTNKVNAVMEKQALNFHLIQICLLWKMIAYFTSQEMMKMMSSGPTEHVADEAIHKERGDSLVRVATIASSLEAEQDSGNTLRSGEDSLKLKELMELCTNLQQRVLDLEKTNTTQAKEIVSLKRRVKKLEQKKRSRTHKLKRLRKVGATARVKSSGGEESLGEDASKQGRIDVIDADDDITLVSVHDVNVSAGKEEVIEVINTVKLIIDDAQVSAAGDKVSTTDAATTVSVATITTATTVEEITLAQALADLKSTKPKAKGIAFREPMNLQQQQHQYL
ncbi:hypothetical protein Tco_0090292 [Tanacetum coccineum]